MPEKKNKKEKMLETSEITFKITEDDEEEYYIDGSWESLMMSYGQLQQTKFKMVSIKKLLFGIDPSIKTWEEYMQSQMDMIPS